MAAIPANCRFYDKKVVERRVEGGSHQRSDGGCRLQEAYLDPDTRAVMLAIKF